MLSMVVGVGVGWGQGGQQTSHFHSSKEQNSPNYLNELESRFFPRNQMADKLMLVF